MKSHVADALLELSSNGRVTKLNDVLRLYSTIHYTADDNDKKQREEDIVFNFTNFIESLYQSEGIDPVQLYDAEDEIEKAPVAKTLSIEDFICFCTGSRYITPSVVLTGTIEFLHFTSNEKKLHSGMRVMVNTCNITLTFPVNDRYAFDPSVFVNNLIDDIYCAPGFGKS